MSTITNGNRGIFRWIASIFKKEQVDPINKNIYDAVAVIDRMISVLDITKRSLQDAQDEHSKKAKIFASEGKKHYEKIFLDELKHIRGLIRLIEKVRVDLIRVKTRLRTIAQMERPLKELPEVVAEIRSLRPEVEKIMPQLSAMILELERKVEDIMISTNLPTTYNEPIQTENTVKSKKDLVLPLPPETTTTTATKKTIIQAQPAVTVEQVKKWILREIKSNGGILDISSFSRKYRVSRTMILSALYQLEREGRIRLKQ